MIPGLPYSVVATLEPGRTSWTAVPGAVRLDRTIVVSQSRRLGARCDHPAGCRRKWYQEDPNILVIVDARIRPDPAARGPACPGTRLAALNWVMQLSAWPSQRITLRRLCKHGGELALADPSLKKISKHDCVALR